ncbi:MAG TPA: protein-L-isoaspartate(D-aspartate) O-methyltransferase [Tepidisphaeraceae bacterium]|nr:protein-L-isoaspartate(D-aspartate) O-methyltransferase [Tepidisphaeraceae bacterium]
MTPSEPQQTLALSAQEVMIRTQVIDRGIRDQRVLDALRAVPRERFFLSEARGAAFADRAAPIGFGQTISQPYIVALMTERLGVQPDHKVLEIGTGSGYQTAILAKLAATVYTIERIKPLLDQAWERLMELKLRNVHFRYGDGTMGWPEAAPFDRILIAAAAPTLPRQLLLDQLRDGGVAVLPVGPEDQQMLLAVHRVGDRLDTTEISPCRFVRLIGQQGWKDEQGAQG